MAIDPNPAPLGECDSPAAVLAFVRSRRAVADQAEVELLEGAVAWASMHSVDSLDDAACLPGAEGEVAIAGPGAPLVTEFAPLELGAALGMSSDAARAMLGEAVELAHRLPRTWAAVRAGTVPAWRGRKVAANTLSLPAEGAAYVDTHVHAVAGKIGYAALDRVIEEARVRFDPDGAEEKRRAAADRRHFDLDTGRVSFAGTVTVDGELDLADALDLDSAVARGARVLGELGCAESLDVRRSLAVGEIARRQLALDLDTTPTEVAGLSKRCRPRQVVVHVHLSAAALGSPSDGDLHLARVENTRSFVSADQVKTWCANPDAQVIVKPVLDLADVDHTTAYEVPDRMAERVQLNNPTCVFPWCTRSARRADNDHVVRHRHEREGPQGDGEDFGETTDPNLAPLCRTHHRAKTHTSWSYAKLDETTFLWRTPNGIHLRRDHTGTTIVG
ncbi:HNH endonuclease [Nocardioides pantholopis]|uniref:HNH endonuclease n=1 Tax=Nocardioides pantholopis TaxID=2483798 RepID=UPI000F093083|nr:HNH endonuclease signature motif containing protein [Nocardioides pantholopis]